MARSKAGTGASAGADTVAVEQVEMIARGERCRSRTPEEKARRLAETVRLATGGAPETAVVFGDHLDAVVGRPPLDRRKGGCSSG